jgi:hypothetical protein
MPLLHRDARDFGFVGHGIYPNRFLRLEQRLRKAITAHR